MNESTTTSPAKAFRNCREHLREVLMTHTLIESYRKIIAKRKRYPFLSMSALKPGGVAASLEHKDHKPALVLLLDGDVPDDLKRNIRVGDFNKVTKKNLQDFAPHMDLGFYDTEKRVVGAQGFDQMLDNLLDLDYGLVVSRNGSEAPFQLTHFHTRIEQLTDVAVAQLAARAGYVESHPLEKGPAFAQSFERKFFEYFGFSYMPSGRRVAAAMASQMLMETGQRFAVFLSSQSDLRLTVFDNNDVITQYLLIHLSKEEVEQLQDVCDVMKVPFAKTFVLSRLKEGAVVPFRVRYERTAPALPLEEGQTRSKKDDLLKDRWVKVLDEGLISLPGAPTFFLPYPVIYRRGQAREKGKKS